MTNNNRSATGAPLPEKGRGPSDVVLAVRDAFGCTMMEAKEYVRNTFADDRRNAQARAEIHRRYAEQALGGLCAREGTRGALTNSDMRSLCQSAHGLATMMAETEPSFDA
ncbi:hypothetical protein F6X40_35380 [Paraburkholderia sp. UCT31]|uniref:hypothetical protein n=1 Tax=Paraburkholderia sp. UCT31 TaxID=2615209 RepID=UPI0016553F5B|nr:hypothetical protein [Paraburkholderia sp. UCT31]MBC8741833.1 hypothetical protein [Paraburkholderia sp. UCT31]